ncbi:MAG: rod shape-determining protein MreC [Armatimonadota bacterium]
MLLAVGLIIAWRTGRSVSEPVADPIGAIPGTLSTPVAAAGSGLFSWFGEQWSAMTGGPGRQREILRLDRVVSRLRLENERLRGRAAEAARYERLLAVIGERKPRPLVTKVVAWLPSPYSDTLLLAAGERHGAKRHCAVRTDVGLVGRIIDSGPAHARVRLLTDNDSHVSAKVVRDGVIVAQGIVHGEGRHRPIVLRFVKPESDLRSGDSVITFGDGGIFPPDIPIGLVDVVQLSTSRIEKWATIRPFAPDPGDLREVMVLAAAPANSAK